MQVLKAHKGTRAMLTQRIADKDSCELLVSGRIDGEGASQLEAEFLALLRNRKEDDEWEIKRIFVNLNGATFLCSAGLGHLMHYRLSMKKRGGQLIVTRPSPEVAAVLKLAEVYDQVVEKI